MVCLVILPLVLVAIWSYQSLLLAPQAKLQGEVSVSGLNSDVTITRDQFGIPTIKAQSDRDVFFAMGYVHAQDRLWQLEVQRRIGQGRLSEVFGRQMIGQDIWIRTLGLTKAAQQAEQHLSPQALASLQAYSQGINHFINNTQQLPVEFSLLDVKPEPWTVVDSLLWVKVFALNLSSNYRQEIQRYISAGQLSNQQLQQLFPDIFVGPVKMAPANSIAGLASLTEVFEQLKRDSSIGGKYVGSNAWVVSGDLTASGMPILANDPHLGLQIPSLWYGVKQQGNKLDVAGMSLVGTPLVIFGANQNITWGGTNMMADVQDLYIEQLNGQDPNLYWAKGQWHEFEEFEDSIEVRAEFPAQIRAKLQPLTFKTRWSIHGPVISDVNNSIKAPISMRWTALDHDDTTYDGFFHLTYAQNWSEFNQALAKVVAPALNVLYADKQNNIGMVGAGRIPKRHAAHHGATMVATADGNNEWQGYLSPEEMPRQFNPASGYLINANDDNGYQGYDHFISADFAPPYRAKRIKQLIEAKKTEGNKITFDDMQQMQLDVKDISADVFLAWLNQEGVLSQLQARASDERKRQAWQLLSQWSGEADESSIGATLYYGFLRYIKDTLFADELAGFWNKPSHIAHLHGFKSSIDIAQITQVIERNDAWCDVVFTETVENCIDMVDSTMDMVVKELEKFKGNDIDDWTWGDQQHTLYRHTPLSGNKMLANFFEKRTSAVGGEHTVNVAASSYELDEGYVKTFGAGFRQVVELAADNKHVYMNSTGQSGQLASDHYDDNVTRFAAGEFVSMDVEPKYQLLLRAVKSEKGGL